MWTGTQLWSAAGFAHVLAQLETPVDLDEFFPCCLHRHQVEQKKI